jgi:hypothetical protein
MDYIKRRWKIAHPITGVCPSLAIRTLELTATSFYCSLPMEAEVHALEGVASRFFNTARLSSAY